MIVHKKICTMSITVFLLLLYLKMITAYNVESRIESTKFLFSPAMKINANESRTVILHNREPSYYGYKLSIATGTSNPSVFISAPKMTNAAAPWEQQNSTDEQNIAADGTVEKCIISFINASTQCNSVRLQNPQPGDSFGLAMDANDENLLACSPAKILNCTSTFITPGFCYKSKDEGQTWESTRKNLDSNCPVQNLDIMFVLDGSGSVTGGNFDIVKDWTANLTKEFDIETGKVHVGVVQYSYWDDNVDVNNQLYVKTEIGLGQYNNETELLDAIGKINYQGYTTATSHALNKTILDFQASSRWSDKSTKKIILLLTDGEATDPQYLPQSADYVRSLGITTFAIGVGNYKEEELRIIATGNLTSRERVSSVNNFEDLSGILKKLRSEILNLVLEGAANNNSVSSDMELGEEGFSITGSKTKQICVSFPKAWPRADTLTIKLISGI
uniref:integrin alpha-D-like n=1 Tax=Styela clava TaxID=7725 RepID=UPI00193ACB75|nr:integrin alpha-D-like [Styela clava]